MGLLLGLIKNGAFQQKDDFDTAQAASHTVKLMLRLDLFFPFMARGYIRASTNSVTGSYPEIGKNSVKLLNSPKCSITPHVIIAENSMEI